MKIKTILSVVLLSCCITPLFSQVEEKIDPELKSIEDRLNSDHASGRERNMVLDELYYYWDTRLNKSYQNLLKHYKNKPNFLKKINKSQRSWIAYRDTCVDCTNYCLSQGDEKNAAGPLFDSNKIASLYVLTKKRCIEIENLLEEIRSYEH